MTGERRLRNSEPCRARPASNLQENYHSLCVSVRLSRLSDRRFRSAPSGYVATVAEFKPSYLIRGLPGHPLHPPLTDATIGIYTFAMIAAVLSKVGVAEHALAQGSRLAHCSLRDNRHRHRCLQQQHQGKRCYQSLC